MAEPLTAWQELFARRARARFPVKIARVVAEPEAHTTTEAVPELGTLLRAAVVVEGGVEAGAVAELVRIAFDAVLIAGAGRDFDGYPQLHDSALELIERLRGAGHPVSRLLLSAARLEIRSSNSTPLRRELIEGAVSAAVSPEERVESLLALAKLHVDLSGYRRARRVLAECARITGRGEAPGQAAQVECTTGTILFYTNPGAAREHLERAVALDPGRVGPRGARQAVAEAVHFLGRIHHGAGEHDLAAEHYVRAEALSDDQLLGHGFFHQRLAEVLVSGGLLREAHFHLRWATATFEHLGQNGVSTAVLDGTWFRYYARTAQHAKAEAVAERGIVLARAGGGHRAELTLWAQLLVLRARERRWWAAFRAGRRVALRLLGVELRGGPVVFGRHCVGAARRISFVLERRGHANPMTGCPCGADHSESSPITEPPMRLETGFVPH